MRILVYWFLFWLGLFSSQGPGFAAPQKESTKQVMNAMAQDLVDVLPYMFKPREFESTNNRNFLLNRFKELKARASHFEAHGEGRDFWFAFMAKTVSQDMGDVLELFEKGAFDQARFVLRNTTNLCYSCHTKHGEKGHFPGFTRIQSDIAKLPVLERAHFLVITRQFDKALVQYENYIREMTTKSPRYLDNGVVAQYLKLGLRVKWDLGRPQKFLSSLSSDKLSKDTRAMLTSWGLALTEIASLSKKRTLATGRKLYEKGKGVMQSPRDWQGLPYFAALSGLMHQLLEYDKFKSQELSEGFFYLGETEQLLGFEFWTSQSEIYYEAAIRSNPTSPYAGKAFRELEHLITLGFSGSSGTHIPGDVRLALDELKKLMANSAKVSKKY